jgi:hypothetical protein
MRIFKHLLAFFVLIVFSSQAISQTKNKEEDEDEDLSYGGIEIPGYVSANASFSFGSTKGNYKINTLVLEGNSNDYMLPEFDVEVGIVDRLSLELITGYRKLVSKASLSTTKSNRSIKTNKTSNGLNSIMLGANAGILSENKLRPAMYIQNQFYLPKTGYSNFQNDQLGYFATFNFENTFSDISYLDYSFGAGWDGNNPYAIYNFNINPNFYLTDDILVYADLGGNYSKYSDPVNLNDIGTTITFSDLFSIDAYIGNELQTKSFAKSCYGALKFTFEFDAFAE